MIECQTREIAVPKEQGKCISRVTFLWQQLQNSWKLTHFHGNKHLSVVAQAVLSSPSALRLYKEGTLKQRIRAPTTEVQGLKEKTAPRG
jgi:hypothetical protein